MAMDYSETFKNLRTNNKYGRKSPHKAVLMLTVIEMFEKNILSDNEILYDDTLKSMFLKVWNRVLPNEPLFHPEAYLPFWYLQSDSFWHIVPIKGKEDILSLMRDTNIKPSEAKLNDSVKYAELDDDLYFLMTIPSGRSSLKRALLETYTQLSAYQIDKMAESSDNVVDHSLSAMDEYEQILLSKNNDEKAINDETSSELEKHFKELSDDLQIVLSYEYFAFLKNHRSDRDMLREVCPNVYTLYDCLLNNPLCQADISPSFTFVYDNFLCDLKIALMSENDSMELIDKIDSALEILHGNYKKEIDNEPSIEELESSKPTDDDDEESLREMVNDSASNGMDVEHVFLDSSGNIISSVTSSDVILEKDLISGNRKGKPWTENEEELITLYFQQGKSAAAIAEIVGRTEVSIKMRLAKLGLIEYTYGQDDDSANDSNNEIAKEGNEDDFKVENLLVGCSIYNKSGQKVFSSDGKLKYINGKLYRLNLKDECFTVKEMLREGNIWIKGSKKIVGYRQSELYKSLDRAYDYCGIIEDIIDSPNFSDCKLKAKGTWYDNNGDIVNEDESTGHSIFKKIKNKVSGILHSDYVPKGKLKEVSNVVDSSYDYLWMMALVEFMQLQPKPSVITYDKMACMMIAIVWEIINEDSTVREKEESLVECIEYLIEDSKTEMGEELDWNSSRKKIYQAIKDYPMAGVFEDMVDELIEKAPCNVLRAWFPEESDNEVIGHSSAFEKSCLYAIHPDKWDPYIELNKNWMKYLFHEHDNLMDYYRHHYLEFLEI